MKAETIAALNAINQRFYHERAEEFSETRERPWRGWDQLIGRLALPPSPSILDIGCGNGRLARFLKVRLGESCRYTGVDSSPLALEEACRRLEGHENVELLEHDFLTASAALPSVLDRRFDLVALFGVLHHVPSQERRRRLLQELARNVSDYLVLTVWLFERFERFRSKLVAWDAYVEKTGTAIDLDDLEPGDHIMTWGNAPVGYRYCHASSDAEQTRLVEASGLELVDRFEPENEPNRYLVLRAPQC